MIDPFTLALTHGLIVLALWRLLLRADLDADAGEPRPPRRPWLKRAADAAAEEPPRA